LTSANVLAVRRNQSAIATEKVAASDAKKRTAAFLEAVSFVFCVTMTEKDEVDFLALGCGEGITQRKRVFIESRTWLDEQNYVRVRQTSKAVKRKLPVKQWYCPQTCEYRVQQKKLERANMQS
jgi:hypothetical protein